MHKNSFVFNSYFENRHCQQQSILKMNFWNKPYIIFTLIMIYLVIVTIFHRLNLPSGYWGMYLLGVRIGSYLFFGENADAMLKTKKWAITRVWALCLFFWYEECGLVSVIASLSSICLNYQVVWFPSLVIRLITLLLDWHVEAISRRMVNAMPLLSLILSFFETFWLTLLYHFFPVFGRIKTWSENFCAVQLGICFSHFGYQPSGNCILIDFWSGKLVLDK